MYNNIAVELAGAIDDQQTNLPLKSGEINKLPDPAVIGNYNLPLLDIETFPKIWRATNFEVVTVTSLGVDSINVDRGQEDTIPSEKAAGTIAVYGATKSVFDNIWTALSNKANSSDVNTKAEILTMLTNLKSEILGGAPAFLDALNEFATAIGNDPNFSVTMLTMLGNKVDKDGTKVLSDNNYTTEEKTKLAGLGGGGTSYTLGENLLAGDIVRKNYYSGKIEKIKPQATANTFFPTVTGFPSTPKFTHIFEISDSTVIVVGAYQTNFFYYTITNGVASVITSIAIGDTTQYFGINVRNKKALFSFGCNNSLKIMMMDFSSGLPAFGNLFVVESFPQYGENYPIILSSTKCLVRRISGGTAYYNMYDLSGTTISGGSQRNGWDTTDYRDFPVRLSDTRFAICTIRNGNTGGLRIFIYNTSTTSQEYGITSSGTNYDFTDGYDSYSWHQVYSVNDNILEIIVRELFNMQEYTDGPQRSYYKDYKIKLWVGNKEHRILSREPINHLTNRPIDNQQRQQINLGNITSFNRKQDLYIGTGNSNVDVYFKYFYKNKLLVKNLIYGTPTYNYYQATLNPNFKLVFVDVESGTSVYSAWTQLFTPDYIGVLLENGNANESKKVAMPGDRASVFNGLVENTEYYISEDGTLTTQETAHFLGTSISTTTIIIGIKFGGFLK